MPNIRLVTWAGETVTPQDDGILYEAALPNNGIIYGCNVTQADANTLHISAGFGLCCGRLFEVFETDILVELSASGTLRGQLYIHMDLGAAEDPIEILYETGSSLTPMQQDSNVNITNGIYEIQLATFTVSTSTISALANTAPTGIKAIGIKDVSYKKSNVTAAGKVLDAREANPNITGTLAAQIADKVGGADFIVRTYLATAAALIGANGTKTFTFTGLQISGYKPISVVSYNLPNGKSFMVTMPQDLLGSDSNSCQIVVGSVNGSGGAIQPSMTILYVRS